MIGSFVCRLCGENGVPAFRNSHACKSCWAAWEAMQEEILRQPAPLVRVKQADRTSGVDSAVPAGAVFPRMESRGTEAPNFQRSLASACAHGAHWCPACESFVTATDGPNGGLACAACGSVRLEYVPPVEGYRAAMEGAA